MSKKTHYGGGFPAGPRGAERAKAINRPWFALLLGSYTASGRSGAIWKMLCVMEWARMAKVQISSCISEADQAQPDNRKQYPRTWVSQKNPSYEVCTIVGKLGLSL